MANAKISDAAFQAEDNVRLISGIPGYKSGTPNTNVKITGQELVESVINSNGSGSQGRIAFYGASGDNLGGSSGLTWDQNTDTLALGVPGGGAGLNGVLNIRGNYIASNEQPQIIFTGGNSVAGSFRFQVTTSTDGTDQTWILPEELPSAGQVLEANAISTNDVTLAWANIPSAGDYDFSSLNITSIKADLSNSSQTQYGEAVIVKASATINNGDVVIWDYSGAEVQAKPPSGSTPDQHEIIGIAIEDIAVGATGKVLTYGYVTAKYASYSITPPATLLLDGDSSGNTTIVGDINSPTSFQDQGGTGNPYSSNSNYTHTFYNNEGNISMKFIDWSTEQGSASLWDRLGFTVSNDGVNYDNAEFTPWTSGSSGGWRTSTEPDAPWGETESTAGPNNSGYILAESPGTGFPVNSVINTGYKYVRAYFVTDGSTQQAGWEIEVYGSNDLVNDSVVAGQSAYINLSDLAATNADTSTGRTLGTFVGSDVTNGAVVMFVAPDRFR